MALVVVVVVVVCWLLKCFLIFIIIIDTAGVVAADGRSSIGTTAGLRRFCPVPACSKQHLQAADQCTC